MSCNFDEASLRRPTKYAIHDAAEANDVTRLTSLLDGEVDPSSDVILDINEKDPAGCTPLHVAILSASVESARELLLRGASFKSKCNGHPPLHLILAMAAVPDNADGVARMLQLLLALEPDLSATDDVGRSALHICGALGLVAAAQTIYKSGVSDLLRSCTDKFGATALHAAAAGRHADMADWLLSVGCLPCDQDGVGDTPAHVAAKAGWREGLEMLLHKAAVHPVSRGTAAGAAAAASASSISAASSETCDDVRMGGAGASSGGAPSYAGPRNWAGLTAMECLPPPLPGLPGAPGTGTLVLTHAVCADHYTCAHPVTRTAAYVPPENTVSGRL